MGEAKRKQLAGLYANPPPLGGTPMRAVLVPKPERYRPPAGTVAILVDETADGRPVAAFELDAAVVAAVAKDGDGMARVCGPGDLAAIFFDALGDWRRAVDGDLSEAAMEQVRRSGLPPAELFGRVLSMAYWMAFGETVEEPEASRMRRTMRDVQLERYGASCLTLAIRVRPVAAEPGLAMRTGGWLCSTDAPGYIDARETPVSAH